MVGMAVGARLHGAAHRNQQPLGGRGDLGDGRVESGRVPGGRGPEAAHLADVLARRRLDLAGCRGVITVTQGSNASTHDGSVPRVRGFRLVMPS
jgi:hypothetical protein